MSLPSSWKMKYLEANSSAVALDGDRHPRFALFTSGGPGTLGGGQRKTEGAVEGERERKASSSKLDFEVSDNIFIRDLTGM